MPWFFVAHFLIVLLVPLLLFRVVCHWEKDILVQSSSSIQPSSQPKGPSLLPAFLGGFMTALPVLALLLILPPWKGFYANLRVAAVEEVGKAIFPMILVRMRGTLSIRKTILLFVASALGFSLMENLLFLVKESESSLIRSFTSVPLHAALSAIFGFAHGFSRYQYKARTFWGGLAAILLHGFYNAGWELSTGIPLGVLILSLAIMGVLWKVAQQIEES